MTRVAASAQNSYKDGIFLCSIVNESCFITTNTYNRQIQDKRHEGEKDHVQKVIIRVN